MYVISAEESSDHFKYSTPGGRLAMDTGHTVDQTIIRHDSADNDTTTA